MSEKNKKFASQLEKLISVGESLLSAIQYDCYPAEFLKELQKARGKNKAEEYLKVLPDFKSHYQVWYSEAKALVKQILPDRINDFVSYYEYPRVRKDITFQNYMIKDYLQGLRITRGADEIASPSAAIPEFIQQLNIVKAAKTGLTSALFDIRSILQADLFDSEIESAEALAKGGFLRAAGAVCGVIIEKHLKEVCDKHGIRFRKSKPTISDLNEQLRKADVVTIPQWRFQSAPR